MYTHIGTHVTHCCVVHGCKYNDECPVADGVNVQEYDCEMCDWAQQEYRDAMKIIEQGANNWFSPPYFSRVELEQGRFRRLAGGFYDRWPKGMNNGE